MITPFRHLRTLAQRRAFMTTVDPTPKQIALLRRLGHVGVVESRQHAADLIDALIDGASPIPNRGRSTLDEPHQAREEIVVARLKATKKQGPAATPSPLLIREGKHNVRFKYA